jgi:RecB family endonuclease NucS
MLSRFLLVPVKTLVMSYERLVNNIITLCKVHPVKGKKSLVLFSNLHLQLQLLILCKRINFFSNHQERKKKHLNFTQEEEGKTKK